MEKIKQYKYIILIGLLILGFAFYWFQIRPAQIRRECYNTIPDYWKQAGAEKAPVFKNCLLEHGL